jgi:hypothetical protein
MAFSSRGWVPFGVLAVAGVVTTVSMIGVLDGATQADFAAASARTTTAAPSTWRVILVAAVLAPIIYAVQSVIVPTDKGDG